MGALVMVLGKSGSGKSSSLRGFEPDEVGVFNVAGKPLPFRKQLKTADNCDYRTIKAALAKNGLNAYVIDDSTYLMQFDMFKYAKVKGYDKFTDMAVDFKGLLDAARATSPDTIVYFLHHPQFNDSGESRPQTVGRMLDNQLCIEGLFPIVIGCRVRDGRHEFVTHSEDEASIFKAPVDVETGERMLPEVMDNDLKAVDTAIRGFWHMAPLKRSGK